MQKKVKLIGLAVNSQLGILQACNVTFDEKNHLNIVKGGVGDGKTTLQKGIQLCTQGSKILTDKQLYGKVDTEVQLLDGSLSIWVGCKSDKAGKLVYSLYTKDNNGKKVKEPVIDGVKATPSAYLEALQTELTWRLDELTSENPTVQKKILLSMYQHAFTKLGVIFDKKNSLYENSILYKIETAENKRNDKDAIRKQVGGIKEDLKAKGFDIERPATIPDAVDIDVIASEIKEQERLETIEETKATSGKDEKLANIKAEGAELRSDCLAYNSGGKVGYDAELKGWNDEIDIQSEITSSIDSISSTLNELVLNKYLSEEKSKELIKDLNNSISFKIKIKEPQEPKYIIINKENQIVTDGVDLYTGKARVLLNKIIDAKKRYISISNEESQKIDLTKFDKSISELEEKKKNGIEINKIVTAINSWFEWSNADAEVKELKKEYVKMLAKVETGVEGLKIVPEETDGKLDIFLMYDGSYDSEYFVNKDKKLIKLSAYSGTQKPIICLLIQNYLLSRKSKAMRYMFIDNIPIDKKTIALLGNMCEKLDLTIFLNITGDFDQNMMKDGEILIEGGEVFFKEIEKKEVEGVNIEKKKIKGIKGIDTLPF